MDRMPGLVQGSAVGNHDQPMTEALERFCSAPEQTYEQFLSTFTYLSPGSVRVPCLTGPGIQGDTSHRDVEEQGEDGVSEIKERLLPSADPSPSADQEEVLLDSGCVGGRLGGPDRPNPEKPVKFDNYLDDSEDEEETTDATGMYALPGEVEEHLTSASSPCHHTLLEISSAFRDHRTHALSSAENESESNEVVPFHLDQNFDYDTVVLSRKFSKNSTAGRLNT